MTTPYVEHACIPDIFVSGLASAEEIGDGNFRFTFYVNHRSVHDGTLEREIVCRIIMPSNAAQEGCRKSMESLGCPVDERRLTLAH